MADDMDKSLMALMGLEDDEPKDYGLALPPPIVHDESPPSSQDISSMLNSDSSQSTQLSLAEGNAKDTTTTHPLPPARSSALFASRDRSSSPPLFSPEFNPFGVPSGKIRVLKAAKKNKAHADRVAPSSMFSPTLSPRKVKGKSSTSKPLSSNNLTLDSSPSPLPSAASSPPLRTTPAKSRPATVFSSPPSSLTLQNMSASGLWDTDSDMSPIEDNLSSHSQTRPIVLNASIPSNTIDTEILNSTRSTSDIIKDSSQDELSDLDKSQDSAEDDISKVSKMNPETGRHPGGLSQKEILQIQMEKEQILRTSSLPIQKRVVKKNLTLLLKDVQANLDGKGQVGPLGDLEPKTAATAPPAKPKPLTIALDDYSDDETEQDVEKVNEYAQWKLFVSRAVLAASITKDRQREIMSDLRRHTIMPRNKRLEIERILQMSPLSNDIQKMSLNGDEMPANSSSASPWTSASTLIPFSNKNLADSQKRPMSSSKTYSISQFHEESRRRSAKMSLANRKKLDEAAKRSGTFKSPEDYATDQLRAEEERRRGIHVSEDERGETGAERDAEDEEDGDYDPEKTPNKVVLGEDEEEMELGSGNEDQVFSGESEGEDGGNNDVAKGASGVDKEDEDGDDENEDEQNEEEGEQDEEDDEEEKVLTTKRQTTKRTVIGDEDEVKVIVVDRSRAPSPSDSEQDDHGSDSTDQEENEDEEANSPSNDHSDISDIEEIMDANGTQGFGTFFEPSIDLTKAKKQRGKQRRNDDVQDQELSPIQASIRLTSYIVSPMTDSDPDQVQSYEDRPSLSDALDLLSGKFVSTTPQSSDPDGILATVDSDSLDDAAQVNTLSSVAEQTAGVDEPTKPKNAFDILTRAMQRDSSGSSQPVAGLRRLHKKVQQRRMPISKNEKSAFIEYEAEEEEDEFMGMGGIDYESDNDQDDYDLADGMVDTTTALNKQDMENVRQLHMKHEQDQHNKEISDLVQGIAAGNLWKRRNGQADDLDLFDEEDMDGRFQRKKKLKVSEKFERLADNPNTAAFAKAFQKHVDDDQIVFLSDPDESNDEAVGSKQDKKKRMAKNDDEDEDMEDMVNVEYGTNHNHSTKDLLDQHVSEEDEEDEPLNTDKRKEKLRLARLLRHGGQGSVGASMTSGAIAAMTKNQVLPFDINPNERTSVVSTALSETLPSLDAAEDAYGEAGGKVQETNPIDEHKAIMRRSKLIRNIIDGVDDHVELSSESSVSPRKSSSFSVFSILDRIVDQPSLASLDAVSGSTLRAQGAAGAEDEVKQIAQPRMLARQSSSFVVEERRQQFLSTVGEEHRGGQASNRVVKEVNRRKMVFTTSKKSPGAVSSSSITMSSTTTNTSTSSNIASAGSNKDRLPTGFGMLRSLASAIDKTTQGSDD